MEKLNFPNEISAGGGLKDLSTAAIKKKAEEVGAMVDALHTNCFIAAAVHGGHAINHHSMKMKPFWFQDEIDLNKKPEPEPGDPIVECCGPCVSYMLRKRALYNDMTRYMCSAGYIPCSGRCGESRCPEFCLATEDRASRMLIGAGE